MHRTPLLLAAVGGLVIAMVCGCTRSDASRFRFSNRFDEILSARAFEAARTLQTEFRQERCRAIYYQASEAFRQYQPVEDWVAQCKSLRSALGQWQTLTMSAGKGGIAHVDGIGCSAAAACVVESAWTLEDGRIRLLSLSVASTDLRVLFRVPAGVNAPQPRRLIDPLLKKDPGHSAGV